MSKKPRSKVEALRSLPSVDQVVRALDAGTLPVDRATVAARRVIAEMRDEFIARNGVDKLEVPTREVLLAEALQRLNTAFAEDSIKGLRKVINATGVILHTNLGRAPLSAAARTAVANAASGYCTLEYDTLTGLRGKRAGRAEDLLKQLTGAEDALVVNNCASAALLILTVLAKNGDTVVSRGELVEIGGDFRVPDVLANSGSRMVEVGTTNRTRLEDYRAAITEQTRLILRIHPSNYRIVGFTAAPTLKELSTLAHESGLWLYEDAGSGVLEDLSGVGLSGEPIIKESIAEGADVVSFSGDKLLGSAQAGLIVGRSEIVSRLRKHSLYRALRADKLCLSALEATLDAHVRGVATSEVPALRMLAHTKEEIAARAKEFLNKLSFLKPVGLDVTVVTGESAMGGGCGPNTLLPTLLIGITHNTLSPDEIENRLRRHETPVVARISGDKVLIDLRTVETEDEAELLKAVESLQTT